MNKYSIDKDTIVCDEHKVDLSMYDFIGSFNEKIAIVKKNNLCGYIDDKAKEICPPIYDEAFLFKDGYGKVGKINSDGKMLYGLIDGFGNEVVPPIYEEIKDFYNYRAVVKRNGKYGYISYAGGEVVRPIYDEANDYSGNRAIVKSYNHGSNTEYDTIILDGYGKKIAIYKGAYIDNYNDCNYTIIKRNSKYGILDKSGKEIVPLKMKHSIKAFNNKLAIITIGFDSNYKVYIYDNLGNIHKLPYCDDLEVFDENTLKMKSRDLFWLSDIDGNMLTKDMYEEISKVSDDIYRYKFNGKFGIMDDKYNYIVKPIYDYISSFSFETAKVKKDGKWGLINKEGKELTDIKYDVITNFDGSISKFKLGSIRGLMDKDGNVLTSYDKNSISNEDIIFKSVINDKYIICQKNMESKYALYDINGNPLTDFTFNSIRKSGNMIIFDEKYMISMHDLDFKYTVIFNNNGKFTIKEFDSIDKRDKYYNLALKEFNKVTKEYNRRVESISNSLGDILYKDLNKVVDSKYKK